MAYMPTIYDWRSTCRPRGFVFVAGAQAVSGGLSVGGAYGSNPEPGGRFVIQCEFPAFGDAQAVRDWSWTMSRAKGGAVFRVALWVNQQMVSADDLNGNRNGATWSNGQTWDNGQRWQFDPFEEVLEAALAGSTTIKFRSANHGQIVQIGHVIGLMDPDTAKYDFSHVVEDVEYDGGPATATISPPLRKRMAVGTLVRFRPRCLVTVQDPESLASPLEYNKFARSGGVRLVEALV